MSEFTCAICGETFDVGWAEEEAVAELAANFPGVSTEDCEVVCDKCFGDVKHWSASQAAKEFD